MTNVTRPSFPRAILKAIRPGVGRGVYIRWNGIVEWNSGMDYWNSGMDYWNSGMLHRTYLIIQHVLYSESIRCVLCMHCWLDG